MRHGQRARFHRQAFRFQSLLYWISHCGNLPSASPPGRLKFQSLLYWISHCGSGSLLALHCLTLRFNPCCIGLAIAARLAPPGTAQRHRGFNPCCIGLAIAAPRCRRTRLPGCRFQSLLYWISHCGPEIPLPDQRFPNVSILVVLD